MASGRPTSHAKRREPASSGGLEGWGDHGTAASAGQRGAGPAATNAAVVSCTAAGATDAFADGQGGAQKEGDGHQKGGSGFAMGKETDVQQKNAPKKGAAATPVESAEPPTPT